MWNSPMLQRLKQIPKLYETENTPLKEKLIHLHFFIGACDWYISEYDGEDIFWGFAILNSDFLNSEWGYISFSELQETSINGIEIDCELEEFFPVKNASQIGNICRGNGWDLPEINPLQYWFKEASKCNNLKY